MESKPQWILALYVFVSFQITGQSTKADADGGNSGFISIDCGASTDYVDEVTGIRYQTDEDFIGSGTNYELPPNVNFHNVPTIERQLMTLRSFPEGDRNCYTLKLKLENQEHKYLIRAIFAYENYDYKSQVPIFDLYVGVNYWDTVRLAAAYFFQFYDIIIQEVPTGAVQVCLVNTGQGTPFINTLELRPVNNSLYSAPLPLALAVRKDVGSGFARTFTSNVSGNKLTGSIPKTLREKDNLQLSVADNPGLCQKDSCKKHKFVIPLIASIAVLVLIAILSLMIWRIKKKRLGFFAKSQKMEIVKQKNREFSYFEVLRITNNFTTLIGEGGFGKVYLSTLEDDTQVAVKLLSPSSKQGYKEFQSEAQLLTLIYHRNLVSLVGYCHENDKKALVYEYMDNGDLDQLLSERNPNVLKWNERLQVAVDAAKGLEYLHNGCKTPIIHRDLKPSNILLNKSKLAKIADFEMSRVFSNDRDSHLSTQPAGTPGYIDPEFQRSGNLNKKSDIYSFGMILLQLITGRPPIKRNLENICFILDWVQSKIECGDIDGIVDPRLTREFGVTSAWKIVEISMSCILPTPAQRPDITYVLQELQECLALEMDHATHNVVTSSSLQYGVNCESMTILSAR